MKNPVSRWAYTLPSAEPRPTQDPSRCEVAGVFPAAWHTIDGFASTGEARLWVAAIILYARDIWDVLHGRRRSPDYEHGIQALADLRGSKAMLRRLCRPIGLDPAEVATIIETRLTDDRRPSIVV